MEFTLALEFTFSSQHYLLCIITNTEIEDISVLYLLVLLFNFPSNTASLLHYKDIMPLLHYSALY